MQKRAIIFDLDNTIYSVKSIGQTLFHSLFDMIVQDGNHDAQIEKIKDDIMRRPFQLVARDFKFSDALFNQGMSLLMEINYEGKIKPFPDYQFTKALMIDKFLVTTGFKKLQLSKIRALGIAADFKEIHVVDPCESSQTKKDVFADLAKRHGYDYAEVLVIGDDLHSEIKAARDLGIDAILYDRDDVIGKDIAITRIGSFGQLEKYLKCRLL